MDTEPQAAFEPTLVISAPSKRELLQLLDVGHSNFESRGPFRLAILSPDSERIEKARVLVSQEKTSRGTQGVWCVSDGALTSGGKLAFMFPGIDSGVKPEVHDVAHFFGLHLNESADSTNLEARGTDVFFMSDLFAKVLKQLGITPHAMLGHSLGEWSGVVASGLTPATTASQVISLLKPGMMPVPGVVFAALGCGVDKARMSLVGLDDIEISHDNCPHQSIVCGVEASVDIAMARLKVQSVLCQKLDFRSGFHTRLFKDFVGPLEQSVRSMSFSTPQVPLWSATTCAPYPSSESEIRKLMIRHLLEPVRFQELTQKLFNEGYRVFVQIGSGSLCGFVDDTLREKPHLALSTAHASRSGLDQLLRFCLALFCEGGNFDLGQIVQTRVQVPEVRLEPSLSNRDLSMFSGLDSSHPLIGELKETFLDIERASLEIVAALDKPASFKKKKTVSLNLESRPELMDHCFYKQRVGWESVHDRFPVLPMTASLDLVQRLAHEHFPRLKVTAIENVSASKWISVEAPRDLEVQLEFDGRDRLKVTVTGHFVATAVLKSEWTERPRPKLASLNSPRASRVPAERLYRDGWMFHGPAFQCIEQIRGVGQNGIDGSIRASQVPGALLDNAGQLAGYWIMESVDIDRYAMPIRIGRIEFFDDQPKSGSVECCFRVSRLGVRNVVGDFELLHEGRLWSRITSWEKWRFETHTRVWEFMLDPGRKQISETRASHHWIEREALSSAQCEDFSRRYLRESERTHYLSRGEKKAAWMLGRVAAKDALREHAWKAGYVSDIFPAEFEIGNDPSGRPIVKDSPFCKALYISISHKPGVAVACVSQKPAVGIDIELIEDRSEAFVKSAFGEVEAQFLPIERRSEWITRFWGAKEAAAKALGMGLQGKPKAFQISEVQDQLIRVGDLWIRSSKFGRYIVSQTEEH